MIAFCKFPSIPLTLQKFKTASMIKNVQDGFSPLHDYKLFFQMSPQHCTSSPCQCQVSACITTPV